MRIISHVSNSSNSLNMSMLLYINYALKTKLKKKTSLRISVRV